MAGNKHHIIPRFLMKGFASRIDDKDVFVWVYRKNASVFEPNTKNINAETHFYGKVNEETYADGIITKLETGKFSPLLDNLKNLDGNVDYLSSEIADFVSNLVIRTKNFRSSFYFLMDDLSERFGKYFANDEKIKKLLLNQPTLLKNEFDAIWQKTLMPMIEQNMELLKTQGYDSAEVDKEKENLFQMFKQEFPKYLDTGVPEFSEKIPEIFAKLRENLPKITKDFHNKHLKQKPISEARVKEYLRLNWFVLSVNSPLILGDAGCIFEVIGKRRFKTFDDTYENLVNVFLPISTNKILVGSKYKTAQSVDVKLINQASANCSFDLFICSENSPDKLKLKEIIGIWASLLTDKEIDYYITQVFQDFDSVDSLLSPNEPLNNSTSD